MKDNFPKTLLFLVIYLFFSIPLCFSTKYEAQPEKISIHKKQETEPKVNEQQILVLATGYTYTGYLTYSETMPDIGTVAVDPEVIPLGTELYIEGYGPGVALDTGGLIKGNRIDLFFRTEKEAINWGKRHLSVRLISDD